jgi:hypothetical protein
MQRRLAVQSFTAKILEHMFSPDFEVGASAWVSQKYQAILTPAGLEKLVASRSFF